MIRKIWPCCGYFTIDSEDDIIVDICEVCFWQYDAVAHDKADQNIGANHISLSDARDNYKKYGVCKEEFKNMVRKPREDELPENN